ncbi:hypothetical protein FOA43_001804 [Brettanomyces nanus]|uniref:DOCKER domain-containing protein n=1 Tax=Eeniella nana TaxID=13502 RepID=A0A875S5J9_EENNA|nr:uncharacterized protein FOA43_001804 [Brettanomyces nanus]QPG74474.1 hypothetical protein FOA43_001804 [Brettanomyces nanus]
MTAWHPLPSLVYAKVVRPFLPLNGGDDSSEVTRRRLAKCVRNVYPGDHVYLFEAAGLDAAGLDELAAKPTSSETSAKASTTDTFGRGYVISQPVPSDFSSAVSDLSRLPENRISVSIVPFSCLKVEELERPDSPKTADMTASASISSNSLSADDTRNLIVDDTADLDSMSSFSSAESAKPARPAVPFGAIAAGTAGVSANPFADTADTTDTADLIGEITLQMKNLSTVMFALYARNDFDFFTKLVDIFDELDDLRVNLTHGLLTRFEEGLARKNLILLFNRIAKLMASSGGKINRGDRKTSARSGDSSGNASILSRDEKTAELFDQSATGSPAGTSAANENPARTPAGTPASTPAKIAQNQLLGALSPNYPLLSHAISFVPERNRKFSAIPASNILIDFKEVSGSSAVVPKGYDGMTALMYLRTAKRRLTQAFSITINPDQEVFLDNLSAALFTNLPASELVSGKIYLVAILTERIRLAANKKKDPAALKSIRKGICAGVADISRVFSRKKGHLASGEAHRFVIKLFSSYMIGGKGQPQDISALYPGINQKMAMSMAMANSGWGELVDRIISGSDKGVAVNPRAETLILSIKELKEETVAQADADTDAASDDASDADADSGFSTLSSPTAPRFGADVSDGANAAILCRLFNRYRDHCRQAGLLKPKRAYTQLFPNSYPFTEYTMDSIVSDESFAEVLVEFSVLIAFSAEIARSCRADVRKYLAAPDTYEAAMANYAPLNEFLGPPGIALNSAEELRSFVEALRAQVTAEHYPGTRWLSLQAMMVYAVEQSLELVEPMMEAAANGDSADGDSADGDSADFDGGSSAASAAVSVSASASADLLSGLNLRISVSAITSAAQFISTLLVTATSQPASLEHLAAIPRKGCFKLTGDLRTPAADLVAKLWDSLGDPASPEDFQRFQINRFAGRQRDIVGYSGSSLLADLFLFCMQRNARCRDVGAAVFWSIIAGEIAESDSLFALEQQCISALYDVFEKRAANKYRPEAAEIKAFVTELRRAANKLDVEDVSESTVSEFTETIASYLDTLAGLQSIPDGAEFDDDRTFYKLKISGYLLDVDRPELFQSFVADMYESNLGKENYTQAALSLQLLADTYDWDTAAYLPPSDNPPFPRQTMFRRKAELYRIISAQFARGNRLEQAVAVYKDLVSAYERYNYDLQGLSYSHGELSHLYAAMQTTDSLDPTFFKISFIGFGFPESIRGKQFIYEGLPYEHITSINHRLIRLYPGSRIISNDEEAAKLLGDTPFGRYLHVKTVQKKRAAALGGSAAAIAAAVTTNGAATVAATTGARTTATATAGAAATSRLDAFVVVRRLPGSSSATTLWTEEATYVTYMTFPTLMNRSEIQRTAVVKLSPVKNAIRQLLKQHDELVGLEALIHQNLRDNVSLPSIASSALFGNLSRVLAGTVDSPVNGGMGQYRVFSDKSCEVEMAAANDEPLPEYQTDSRDLKQCLNGLVGLLCRLLKLHGLIVPEGLLSQHQAMLELFGDNFRSEIKELRLDMTTPLDYDILMQSLTSTAFNSAKKYSTAKTNILRLFSITLLSAKHVTLSINAFAGKVFAYAFFRLPDISHGLTFLLNTKISHYRLIYDICANNKLPIKTSQSRDSIEHDSKAHDQATRDTNSYFAALDQLIPIFPPYLQELMTNEPRKTRFKIEKDFLNSINPPQQKIKGINETRGPWCRRWASLDNIDLFCSFMRHYLIAVAQYLADKNPSFDISENQVFALPGFMCLLTHIYEIANFQIHQKLIQKKQERQQSLANANATIPGGIASAGTSPNASATNTPPQTPQPQTLQPHIPPGTGYTATDKLSRMLRDFLVNPRGPAEPLLIRGVIKSFENVLKLLVCQTRILETFMVDQVFSLFIDLVKNVQDHDSCIDWQFWIDVWMKLLHSRSIALELRALSILYQCWDSIPEVTCDNTHDIISRDHVYLKSSLGLELVSGELFSRFFGHYLSLVRCYYIRFVVWKVLGVDSLDISTKTLFNRSKLVEMMNNELERTYQLTKEVHFKPTDPLATKRMVIKATEATSNGKKEIVRMLPYEILDDAAYSCANLALQDVESESSESIENAGNIDESTVSLPESSRSSLASIGTLKNSSKTSQLTPACSQSKLSLRLAPSWMSKLFGHKKKEGLVEKRRSEVPRKPTVPRHTGPRIPRSTSTPLLHRIAEDDFETLLHSPPRISSSASSSPSTSTKSSSPSLLSSMNSTSSSQSSLSSLDYLDQFTSSRKFIMSVQRLQNDKKTHSLKFVPPEFNFESTEVSKAPYRFQLVTNDAKLIAKFQSLHDLNTLHCRPFLKDSTFVCNSHPRLPKVNVGSEMDLEIDSVDINLDVDVDIDIDVRADNLPHLQTAIKFGGSDNRAATPDSAIYFSARSSPNMAETSRTDLVDSDTVLHSSSQFANAIYEFNFCVSEFERFIYNRLAESHYEDMVDKLKEEIPNLSVEDIDGY